MSQSLIEKDYANDLLEIKKSIRENRNKALIVVNATMNMTYYQIGAIINKRKVWGNAYVKRLANDLMEYGRGFSYQQLMRMSQFAKLFTYSEILSQPAREIPWMTINEIMNKSSSKEEMIWYINQAYQNKWSRRIVKEQFRAKAYERKLIAPQVTDIVEKDEHLKDIFKDTLSFDFLWNAEIKDERDLKDKLLDNIILFLQELGPGFSLVGREYKLVTPTNKNFYIDLLMYHTKIHAYVVIEVKIGDFEPSDIGQLQFYINAIDDLEKTKIDNPTVGLLLCKTADSYVVKTTLQGMSTAIGVSKYKMLNELPNYLLKRMKEIE